MAQRKPEWYGFVTKLTALEGEAARLGLWKTMHKLNAAKREAGYERAIQLDPRGRRTHERSQRQLEKNR